MGILNSGLALRISMVGHLLGVRHGRKLPADHRCLVSLVLPGLASAVSCFMSRESPGRSKALIFHTSFSLSGISESRSAKADLGVCGHVCMYMHKRLMNLLVGLLEAILPKLRDGVA